MIKQTKIKYVERAACMRNMKKTHINVTGKFKGNSQASYDTLTILKMKAARSFETSASDYAVTQRRIPKQQNFRLHTRHNRSQEKFPFR